MLMKESTKTKPKNRKKNLNINNLVFMPNKCFDPSRNKKREYMYEQ